MKKINYRNRYGEILLGYTLSPEDILEKFSEDLKTSIIAQKHQEKGNSIIEFRIPKGSQYINFDTLYISTAFLIAQYGYVVENYKIKNISVIKRTEKTITVAVKIIKNSEIYSKEKIKESFVF